jgi:phosphinothricin tripeptide acetyl hydrolase
MPNPQLDAILAQVRAAPFDPLIPEARRREQIDRLSEVFPAPADVAVTAVTLGGVPGERLVAAPGGPIVLYFHGGGYVMGSPRSHRHLAARLAADIAGEVYVPDYRLAPEAPFPAALDDALAAYRALVALSPERPIALAGDSAGGGLVFAAAVAIRDAGLPAPAALVGISPWVNLGTENASYDQLAAADPMLSRAACDYFSSRYLAGRPARDPGASPLFAPLAGLPRTLIQVGDRECFFGDAALMHQTLIAAGVDTELRVWKAMFHVWHIYWPILPQGRDAIAEIAAFLTQAP